jgi:hypothetical protein
VLWVSSHTGLKIKRWKNINADAISVINQEVKHSQECILERLKVNGCTSALNVGSRAIAHNGWVYVKYLTTEH